MAHTHDVFLSYSSRDAGIVHDLAERLRDEGLRVWLDTWEIEPGDSIPSRIEAGLEGSTVLVLCMSEHALGSDWAALESQTFRFRDPLNRDRRFIPLRLDDAPPRGSLGQFQYIDWRHGDGGELHKLVRACRPPAAGEVPALADGADRRSVSLGHTDDVTCVACHPDGRRAISGGDDCTLRVWDLDTGVCERVLEGHAELRSGGSQSTPPAGAPSAHRMIGQFASGTFTAAPANTSCKATPTRPRGSLSIPPASAPSACRTI